MALNIYDCIKCGKRLNDIETANYDKLIEHWNGIRKKPPYCTEHFIELIENGKIDPKSK